MATGSSLIRTLDIGGVLAPTNLVLSPMSGVTDCAFRSLVREMSGPALGLVVSEFISSEGLTRANPKTLAMLRFKESERPVSIQIFGADVDRMARAAEMVEEAGADIVDVNCGCPAPKVVRRGGGAELMRQPGRLGAILRAIKRRVSVPMTVKIRSGWDDDSLNALDIARLAADEGASMLAVHGRTRRALYTGQADWDLVARIKAELPIPVIGSGDLSGPDAVLSRLAESGADGVMIGRGSCGRPWFLRQVVEFLATGRQLADPSLAEQCKILHAHYDGILAHYGTESGVRVARKHLGWYSKGLRNSADFRAAVNQCTDPDRVRALIDVLYLDAREAA